VDSAKGAALEGSALSASQTPPLLHRIAAVTRRLGLGLIALGVLAAVLPAVSGGAAIAGIGLVLLAAGLVLVVFGWRIWSAGKGAFGLVTGGITTVCGGALVANPVSSLSLVATLVAAYLVVGGVSQLLFGGGFSAEDGQGWVLGDAVVSIGLGVAMWLGWPVSGIRALGLLVGIRLASAGAVMLRVEQSLERVGDRVTNLRARLGRRR
jgi:uncharacterized membrane protein HdeD (DUF308 family)